MDKLAPAIAWLKKNSFWLASAFLAIGMLGGWYVATSAVSSETSKNANAVKQQINAARGIRSVTATDVDESITAHPNQYTEAGMQKEMSRQVDDIVKAWELRHKAQASILKWPTEIIGSPEFVRVFGRFDPPETFPESFKGLGMEQFLTLYRNNIPKQMDKICEMVRTNWTYNQERLEEEKLLNPTGSRSGGLSSRGGGSTRGRLTDEDLIGVAVIWDQVNQDLWYQKLTEFRNFDDHNLPTPDPTPLQVYMLQQDLWLLEAMFGIIRQINGDVNANDLATIKQIDHVAFGREARTQLGELTPVDTRLAGGGDDSGDSFPGSATGATAPISDFDQAASTSPFHGRYVDEDFQPYSAEEVKDVIMGTTLPDDNIELIVSKRVPVRIALSMDERKIADFLAACANSPFAFEIHQVRINRHVAGEGIQLNGGALRQDGGGLGGGRGGAYEEGFGGFEEGGFLEEGGRGGFGGGSAVDELDLKSTPVEIRTNYDVNVEFYGIVKIYNPVREKFLRQAAGLEETDVDPDDAASVVPLRYQVAIKE
jgi:hypothetical protein